MEGLGNRLKMLEEASRLLEMTDSNDIEANSWKALAKLPLDTEKAQDLAWATVQDFWSRKRSDRPHSEELDAVLRGLLVGGNLEEAQSLVVNQLKKLPVFEQTKFRQLAAASCLRQVVADYLSIGDANTSRLVNDYALLDLAVRLQPEADGLSEVLIEIGSMKSEKMEGSLVDYVKQVITGSDRGGLSGISDAVKSLNDGNTLEIRKAVERVCQDELAYGVLATNVAMSMVGDDRSIELAVVWLKVINELAPDVLAAWFARGSLHLKAREKTGEKEQAIECFEYLAKRLPENDEVKEMLDEARK